MIWCSIRKSGEPWKECRHHCKKLAKQYYFYRMMMLDESPVFMSIEHPMGGKYEVVFMPRGTSLNQSQYCEVYRDIYGDMTYGKRIEVELRIPDCIIPELDPHIQVVPLLNFEPEPDTETETETESDTESERSMSYSDRRFTGLRLSGRRYTGRRMSGRRMSGRRMSGRRSPKRYNGRKNY